VIVILSGAKRSRRIPVRYLSASRCLLRLKMSVSCRPTEPPGTISSFFLAIFQRLKTARPTTTRTTRRTMTPPMRHILRTQARASASFAGPACGNVTRASEDLPAERRSASQCRGRRRTHPRALRIVRRRPAPLGCRGARVRSVDPGDRVDVRQLERERAPEDAAVGRDVEPVARGVEHPVGIVLGDRDRESRR